MTNILVTAMLLTGGSAVASSLTGVPVAAACFLLPVGVVLYTMFGGEFLLMATPRRILGTPSTIFPPLPVTPYTIATCC
jgi:hypothetical protein